MYLYLKLFLVALILSVAYSISLFVWTAWHLPEQATSIQRPALVLLTAQGEPFARRGAYREAPVDVAALPRHVVAPVLAIEDRRFYSHGALDVRAMFRAALVNLKTGEARQGASTITQQLAKVTITGDERSLARKLQEAVVAFRLEHELSKDEILSRYLSSVYLGDGVYGLRAAARHYFEKAPEDLTLSEAAMLAGVINKPSRLAPTRHLAAAQARSRLVLAAMADAGWFTEAQVASTRLSVPRLDGASMTTGPYFADWVAPALEKALGSGYGEVAVRTTLDGPMQARAEQVVRNALSKNGKRMGASQAALVAMRPNGEVVAMVGGRDYAGSQYNRAAQAERQPGSAFKLFVYLAALRAGASPDSLIDDRPIRVAGWTPRNFGGGHAGPIPLRQAFATSNNVAAVRISEAVGRDAVARAARDLGVTSALKDLPSLALGAGSTTLIEMTSAYAAVAAGLYPATAVGRPIVRDGSGSAWGGTPLDPYVERAPLLDLLRSAVDEGTGRSAALPIPAFGKTGTTQNYRDAWFIGFAGDLVVGVWVGNDDESPMKGVTGGGLPAQIWHAFMQGALAPEIADAEARSRSEREAEAAYGSELVEPEPSGWIDRLGDALGLGNPS